MKESLKAFILIILIVGVVFAGIGFVVDGLDFFNSTTPIQLTCPTANLSCPQLICNCPNQPIQYITQKEVTYTSHFQEIITGCYIERPYELVKWDCDVITAACVKRLQNAGYKCFARNGKYNKGTEENKVFESHTWINCGNNLIVEATTGEIIHPKEYWRYV